LLSAEERVNRAMARVRAGTTFTPGQERWLNLIRNHLVENLAVDRRTFAFTRVGATWGCVNRDFEGRLGAIIAQINEAMVL
jgi:type I restriction enzyme R subunit